MTLQKKKDNYGMSKSQFKKSQPKPSIVVNVFNPSAGGGGQRQAGLCV